MPAHSRALSYLACLILAPLGCAAPADSDATEVPPEGIAEQAVGADIGLPDWNWDGVIDGKDAVSYLEYYGIRFDTYRLTDDVHNLAVTLPHRPWDLAVKTISESCLASQ